MFVYFPSVWLGAASIWGISNIVIDCLKYSIKSIPYHITPNSAWRKTNVWLIFAVHVLITILWSWKGFFGDWYLYFLYLGSPAFGIRFGTTNMGTAILSTKFADWRLGVRGLLMVRQDLSFLCMTDEDEQTWDNNTPIYRDPCVRANMAKGCFKTLPAGIVKGFYESSRRNIPAIDCDRVPHRVIIHSNSCFLLRFFLFSNDLLIYLFTCHLPFFIFRDFDSVMLLFVSAFPAFVFYPIVPHTITSAY